MIVARRAAVARRLARIAAPKEGAVAMGQAFGRHDNALLQLYRDRFSLTSAGLDVVQGNLSFAPGAGE